jgi:hypothetical protein
MNKISQVRKPKPNPKSSKTKGFGVGTCLKTTTDSKLILTYINK